MIWASFIPIPASGKFGDEEREEYKKGLNKGLSEPLETLDEGTGS